MRSTAALAASLVGVLALSACGLLPGSEDEGPSEEPSEEALPESDFPYVKEGRVFTEEGQDIRIRMSVTRLENGPDYAMMESQLTFLEEIEGNITGNTAPLRLVDPINGLAYEQFPDPDNPDERAFGPIFDEAQGVGTLPIHEGAPTVYRSYYPRVGEDTTHLSITGLGMGVFSGIPVDQVDQITPPEPANAFDLIDEQTWESDIPEGTEVWYDYVEPEGQPEGEAIAMETLVDTEELSVTRSGTTETISLNADVSFAFGESDLDGEAEDLLIELAGYMEENLDESGEITVVGHTDGIGGDSANQALSEDRAASVRHILDEEMGGDFQFATEGRGSEEPLATEGGNDDEEARARNRRVEFSYELSLEEAEDRDLDVAGGALKEDAGVPAEFSADNGEPHTTLSDGDVDLSVYPLVRDGAYVIQVLGFTNTGTAPVDPELGGEAAQIPGQPDEFNEGSLAGFQLVEGEVVRSVVQLRYADDSYQSFADEVQTLHPGEEYLVSAVYRAPEASVTELDMNAGAFGEVEGVPIQ